MAVDDTTTTPTGATMTNTEFFCEALDRHVRFPSNEPALELFRACGAVWNVNSTMPINARPDINAMIPSFIEFEQ